MNKGGRRRSIPEAALPDVHRLRATGMGYQRIAIELERLGVWTSRWSVERLLKKLPPYQGSKRLGHSAGTNDQSDDYHYEFFQEWSLRI